MRCIAGLSLLSKPTLEKLPLCHTKITRLFPQRQGGAPDSTEGVHETLPILFDALIFMKCFQ